MLYKVRREGGSAQLLPLESTTLSAEGLLEKDLEDWLATNPRVVPEDEDLLVIHQEKAFENLTDILALDRLGNVVVIEVKRGQTPRDVIAQALEYAAQVQDWDYKELNERATHYFAEREAQHASLLDAWTRCFVREGGELTEERFNQRQRVFIVGEEIEPKIERTTRWLRRHGVDIACVSYRCYRGSDGDLFLDVQEVVKLEESVGPGHVGRPPVSVEEWLERMSNDARDLYVALRERVCRFGPDVRDAATPGYLKFSAKLKFAELQPYKAGLHIWVRPEGHIISEGESAPVHGLRVKRVPDTHGWTLNHGFDVEKGADLSAAERLLRQSYEAVRSNPRTSGT